MLLLIMAGILLFTGQLMINHPPKEINNLLGFRTKESIMSQDKWDKAQILAGRSMIKSSLICLIFGFAFLVVELYALIEGLIDSLFTITLLIDAFILILILGFIVIVTNKQI